MRDEIQTRARTSDLGGKKGCFYTGTRTKPRVFPLLNTNPIVPNHPSKIYALQAAALVKFQHPELWPSLEMQRSLSAPFPPHIHCNNTQHKFPTPHQLS